jgi:hypothetical protein
VIPISSVPSLHFLPGLKYLAEGLIFYAYSKHMDKHDRPYVCKIDGCNHRQGFTSNGDLLRHQQVVHKFDSGQHRLLFCDEPNCARGPKGGPDVGFSRKDNLADHIRRKHRQSSPASRVPARVEAANDTIQSEAEMESPQHTDGEPVMLLPRKRRRISGMGMNSENADRGDGEMIYLRNELTKMTQRVEELTKELKEAQKKNEEKTETLVGIIERLVQQSKQTT